MPHFEVSERIVPQQMLRDAFYRLKPFSSGKASIRDAWVIHTLGIADRHTTYIHDLIESGATR